jgi:hypothetical protein
MNRVPLVALLVVGVALPATAGPVDFTSRIGRHRENRIFWMADSFPGRSTADVSASTAPDNSQKWTKTYVEGLARRFGPEGGHLDLFGSRLGASGPALSGTVDGGAAKLVLRWQTNQ